MSCFFENVWGHIESLTVAHLIIFTDALRHSSQLLAIEGAATIHIECSKDGSGSRRVLLRQWDKIDRNGDRNTLRRFGCGYCRCCFWCCHGRYTTSLMSTTKSRSLKHWLITTATGN